MQNKKEILILSVGGSPEPLIYSINEFQPDKVIFIHSPQTLYQCGIILNKVDWHYENNELSEYVNNFEKEIDELKERKESDVYPSFEDIKSLKYYGKIIEFLNKNITNILEETNISEDNIFIAEISDSESLDESFAISKEVFSKISNENALNELNVKVDFTGGTKPMVSGIVLGVIEGDYPNFNLSYVGAKDSVSRDKNGVGVVKDGYEITKMQKDPYKKYAITEFKRGKNFFNTYQFGAAKQNFISAKTRVTDNQKKLAGIYEEIVILYQKWDTFNDKKSNKKKSKLIYEYLKYITENIEKDPYIYNNLDIGFYKQLKNNLNFLSYKYRGVSLDSEDDLEKSNLKYRIQYYLPDLLNNAYRRIEEGKYDDAVARLYRINELIAQIKLCEYGLIDENILHEQKSFKININNVLSEAKKIDNFENVKEFIDKLKLSEQDLKKGTYGISNDKSFELLELFGFVEDKEFGDLNLALKVRNTSILAHGLKPIKEKTANNLFKKTVPLVKIYFPNIEKQMKCAEFPKFNF